MDVADASDDVQVTAEASDVDPQDIESGGIAILDLADPRLSQTGSLSQLSLADTELLTDLGQLRPTDRREQPPPHVGPASRTLGAGGSVR